MSADLLEQYKKLDLEIRRAKQVALARYPNFVIRGQDRSLDYHTDEKEDDGKDGEEDGEENKSCQAM
jgi:hypothetical protein